VPPVFGESGKIKVFDGIPASLRPQVAAYSECLSFGERLEKSD